MAVLLAIGLVGIGATPPVSADRASGWQRVSPAAGGFRHLITGPGEVIVAVDDGYWRSPDAGRSWQALPEIPIVEGNPRRVDSACLDAQGDLLLGADMYHPEGGGYSPAELFRVGKTVRPLPVSLTSFEHLAMDRRGTLFVAGIPVSGQSNAVLRSRDNGRTWRDTRVPAPAKLSGDDSWRAEALLIDANGDLVMPTTRGTLRRGARTGVWTWLSRQWQPVDPDADPGGYALDGRGNLVVGTRKGVFRSPDLGQTWQPIGLQDKEVTSLAYGRHGLLLAGTPGGVFRKAVSTAGWIPLGLSDVAAVAVVADRYLLAGTAAGLFRRPL